MGASPCGEKNGSSASRGHPARHLLQVADIFHRLGMIGCEREDPGIHKAGLFEGFAHRVERPQAQQDIDVRRISGEQAVIDVDRLLHSAELDGNEIGIVQKENRVVSTDLQSRLEMGFGTFCVLQSGRRLAQQMMGLRVPGGSSPRGLRESPWLSRRPPVASLAGAAPRSVSKPAELPSGKAAAESLSEGRSFSEITSLSARTRKRRAASGLSRLIITRPTRARTAGSSISRREGTEIRSLLHLRFANQGR